MVCRVGFEPTCFSQTEVTAQRFQPLTHRHTKTKTTPLKKCGLWDWIRTSALFTD